MREEGEAASRCINTNCPARLKESILHFASRGVMNIDGMGDALVDQLVDRGLVQQRRRSLRPHGRDSCMSLERMGTEIGRQRHPQHRELQARIRCRACITALGIRFVGERTAVFLAEAFGSMDAIAAATVDELQQAEEVGPKVAESIFQFFREPRNQELVERLRAAGLQFTYASTRPKGGPLDGHDLRADRHPAHAEPRRSQGADRERRRQGERLGEQEDQLRGGRRRCRLQARQGPRTGHSASSTKTQLLDLLKGE